MVASVSPEATDAGVAVLERGGNAVDAAAAVALTLGVVDANNSGLGGGCLLLIRTRQGRFVAIDGRERAPLAATRDMFLRGGKPDSQLSQTGALAIGVPGSLAAYDYALKKFGRKPLRELILPAADLAERGSTVSPSYARLLRSVSNELASFTGSREIFFRDGAPLKEGSLLRQPDLARSYRAIAAQGPRWFYRGAFAAKTEAWMRQNGGLLTAHDFEKYRVVLRDVVVSRYRDFEIIGFPPPSSGGVLVAELLNVLERFDLPRLAEPDRYHLLAEAMKFAFADRARWLGDSDFVRVPRGLLEKTYAAQLAAKIRLEHSLAVPSHGFPPDWEKDVFKKHTTHFSVADAEGNWVACTATVNTSFGSKVVIPGTGIVMNNQMDDFSIHPGTTNYFGLVGSDANAVAPGKRPLSSMSPTIVLRGGKPVAALGAAGGPTIISQVVQQLIWMLDFGLSPAEALAKPRVHHQWLPDELLVEKTLEPEIRRSLVARGHKVRAVDGLSALQVIAARPDGTFIGSPDPRSLGKAAGF